VYAFMDKIKVIKAECSTEFKKKIKDFAKTQGETESAIVRKALLKYVSPAPK